MTESPGDTREERETNRQERKNTFISRKRQRDETRDRDRVKDGDGEGSKGRERKESGDEEREGWRCGDQRGGREQPGKRRTKRRMRERGEKTNIQRNADRQTEIGFY